MSRYVGTQEYIIFHHIRIKSINLQHTPTKCDHSYLLIKSVKKLFFPIPKVNLVKPPHISSRMRDHAGLWQATYRNHCSFLVYDHCMRHHTPEKLHITATSPSSVFADPRCRNTCMQIQIRYTQFHGHSSVKSTLTYRWHSRWLTQASRKCKEQLLWFSLHDHSGLSWSSSMPSVNSVTSYHIFQAFHHIASSLFPSTSRLHDKSIIHTVTVLI